MLVLTHSQNSISLLQAPKKLYSKGGENGEKENEKESGSKHCLLSSGEKRTFSTTDIQADQFEDEAGKQ